MTGRRALFIDGANLDRTARNLGFEIDYKRLLLEFEKSGTLVRSYFYLAIRESAAGGVQRLTDWLEVNRFTVRTRLIKSHEGEGRRSRRSIGIDLAIDALEIAPRVDEVFLFSGDGDFRALVEAVQRLGVRVTVVSSVQMAPAMVSEELRRQADEFLELATLRNSIER
ncbi:NYN domain-containing protein [Bradyrhizobium sp. LB11.1]|uniref:LabA-like NYN domain-containing protein n=1 Tax=Bradyrhizobium sp. LB11.1 TaxID=3156326 RepID=UPI0033994F8F